MRKVNALARKLYTGFIRCTIALMKKFTPPYPDTPCVAVCSTTFDEICRGCGRTVDEVAQWVFMSQEEKNIVWERILEQGYPRRNS